MSSLFTAAFAFFVFLISWRRQVVIINMTNRPIHQRNLKNEPLPQSFLYKSLLVFKYRVNGVSGCLLGAQFVLVHDTGDQHGRRQSGQERAQNHPLLACDAIDLENARRSPFNSESSQLINVRGEFICKIISLKVVSKTYSHCGRCSHSVRIPADSLRAEQMHCPKIARRRPGRRECNTPFYYLCRIVR